MRMTASVLSLLTAAAVAAPAAGAAGPIFDGDCDATGAVSSSPPIGLVPRPVHYAMRATGTCSGTVAGRIVRHEPVEVAVELDDRLGGCLSGWGAGTAAITFGRLGLVAGARLQGVGGPVTLVRAPARGLAVVTAFTRQDRQPPDVLQRCAAGTLRSFVMQVLLLAGRGLEVRATETPA